MRLTLLMLAGFILGAFLQTLTTTYGRADVEPLPANTAKVNIEKGKDAEATTEDPPIEDGNLRVQAILNPKSKVVVASAIDAKIAKFNVENGDLFKKGDVLIEYDCSIDYARLKEAESRQKTTQAQLEAFTKLHTLRSVSEIEYLVAQENNTQNQALVEQIQARLKSCRVVAPFDGRVTNKTASRYEFVQTGRVLLDIASRENLRAEFLIPSQWLRWLNLGTPLKISINETDRSYNAKIVVIHGEVDPVSQSVQVVAQMDEYHEELLQGMSGLAIFDKQAPEEGAIKGFLGLIVQPPGGDSHESEK